MQKLLLALLLCALPAGAEDKLTLLLDWYINPDHAALIVAQQKGFFKKHDLAVEFVEPSDASAPPKLVAAGQGDLAVTYQPQLYLQQEKELPLIRVSTLIATPLNSLIVRGDSDIKELKDLKGKRLGHSAGGMESATLGTLLKQAGLSTDDLTLVNVNLALTPALLSKQVDAVYGAYRNVELLQMEQEGVKGRAFYVEEQGMPHYDELIIVARKDKINREVLARFNGALREATSYLLNHREAGWQAYQSYNKELGGEKNRKIYEATLPHLAHRPGAFSRRGYEDFAKFLKEQGLIKEVKGADEYAIEP